ncbi:MAG: ROK family transcriptional regulator [Phycisphaerae bacterium]|nr:ROK family transcriptional regulator [Phycisphaerae bacterium]
MKNTNPIDSKNAGIRNERLILSLLHKHKELSQAQLRTMTGLNSSTASYIVARLREKELIIETRGQSEKRGAKPILISINPAGQHIIGTEINVNHIFIGIFDSQCNLLETIKAPLGLSHSVEHVINTLEVNIRGLMSKRDFDIEKIMGISIALSGSVTSKGTVRLSSSLGWKDVGLKKLMSDRMDCPIHVFPTRVRLFAEGNISDKLPENIIYFNVANGVGATVTIRGNLLYGAHDMACEIGHTIIDSNGPRCGCGHNGCLESYISGPAIAKSIRKAIRENTDTSLTDTIKDDDSDEQIVAKWGARCIENDTFSLKLRENVANLLAKVVAIAINCYDPQVVILAGYVSQTSIEFFIEAIKNRLKTDVYNYESRNIKIIPAMGGPETLIRGGALAIYKSYMEIG